MDFCSCFFNYRVFFGGYPTALQFQTLLDHGIDTFIDLTTIMERLRLSYDYSRDNTNHKFSYINFPIQDNHVPRDEHLFFKFLCKIRDMILSFPQRKFYIHCKGGHGRSGILVACLLFMLTICPLHEVIEMTTRFHDSRPNLKKKWKGRMCPQTIHQRRFVLHILNHFVVGLKHDANV